MLGASSEEPELEPTDPDRLPRADPAHLPGLTSEPGPTPSVEIDAEEPAFDELEVAMAAAERPTDDRQIRRLSVPDHEEGLVDHVAGTDFPARVLDLEEQRANGATRGRKWVQQTVAQGCDPLD